MKILGTLALGLVLATAPAAGFAQEHGTTPPAPSPTAAPAAPIEHAADAAAAEPQGEAEASVCGHHGTDYILPHITDSRCLDLPRFPKVWETREVALPQIAPIHIGSFALDISLTKHVVMLFLAAFLCCLVLILAAQAHKRHHHAVGRPKGFAAGIEAMVLYIRNEVAIPNLGHHGEGFAPFILTLFWFILFANLLGLIPFGATATGNIAVTATLAIITFVMIEIAGIRAQGLGYLNTLFYWNKDLSLPIRIPMFFIMSPVEMVGKITKPFALAIRLFANMTAGHIVMLALIGLIFTFGSYLIGLAPAAMAVAIMMLELFVAFLQAFIFSLLASVFIGQIRESHH